MFDKRDYIKILCRHVQSASNMAKTSDDIGENFQYNNRNIKSGVDADWEEELSKRKTQARDDGLANRRSNRLLSRQQSCVDTIDLDQEPASPLKTKPSSDQDPAQDSSSSNVPKNEVVVKDDEPLDTDGTTIETATTSDAPGEEVQNATEIQSGSEEASELPSLLPIASAAVDVPLIHEGPLHESTNPNPASPELSASPLSSHEDTSTATPESH